MAKALVVSPGFSLSHKSLDEDVNEYLSFRRSILAESPGRRRAMLLSLDWIKVKRGTRTGEARSGFNGDRLAPRKVMIFELARDRRESCARRRLLIGKLAGNLHSNASLLSTVDRRVFIRV